jgi:hypothetical protein
VKDFTAWLGEKNHHRRQPASKKSAAAAGRLWWSSGNNAAPNLFQTNPTSKDTLLDQGGINFLNSRLRLYSFGFNRSSDRAVTTHFTFNSWF